MTDITLGEETITTFRQAVERVAALAHAKLPAELHGNLERAHALVLHRHVWMDEDGKHAQVLSSDGTTFYLVNGNCTCMGVAHAKDALCKHRLAVMLYRRASELLATSASSGAPTPAAAALPEAPASVNVRLCIGGHECQFTMRDMDEARLVERLQALLARFPQAAPAHRQAPPTPAAPAQPTPEGWCLVHNLQMSRQSNERGSWFSHQTADGWCRGKAPRA
jgi:hypothetical protein